MNSSLLLNLKNISFRFDTQWVLKDINLTVTEGEFLGIIGPNGSGKTTLLKIILGLIKPQKGTVSLFGKDISSFTDFSLIGYVSQKVSATIPSFPVSVSEIMRLGPACNDDAIEKTLKDLNIISKKNSLINELSGGEQQRVFIARALARHPKLLILDEPTVGVDEDSQSRFYELLNRFRKSQGLTIILISHDIDMIASQVNSVACLNRTLIGHGKPRDILSADTLTKLYGTNERMIVHTH